MIPAKRSGTRFEGEEDVLDAIFAARLKEDEAWVRWFAVGYSRSDEYESARVAYVAANAEINRLIEIDNRFREQKA